MIRKANVNDAEQLSVLNEEFNSKGETKKSFCYDEYMPEITEVYVNPTYRKKGIASKMITFAEDYCAKNYPLHKYELLTGKKNLIAQAVYGKLGYRDDNEIHLSKRKL
ncbi:MAG: GNAT family N-acetyltransferase [Lachnospiraceae bacterium]|nr:GNAT family N-acetyltransferase [Lachnospiraceae bacterium]